MEAHATPCRLILSTIVEGHGEDRAFPILLRRIADWLQPGLVIDVPSPIRVKRDRFLRRADEREKVIRLACLKGDPGECAILVLLDADDDCPAKRGPELLQAIQAVRSDYRVSVVLAKYEYEAWFLAAAVSLRGNRKLPLNLEPPADAEAVRGAKEWLAARRPDRKYNPVLDQPALSQCMDLAQARARSASFDKLCRDLERWFAASPSSAA